MKLGTESMSVRNNKSHELRVGAGKIIPLLHVSCGYQSDQFGDPHVSISFEEMDSGLPVYNIVKER